MQKNTLKIATWKQFSTKVRKRQQPLLLKVSEMDSLIFVTGCQRSGTTLLTKLLMQSQEIFNYQTNLDSELEGALILSGHLPHDIKKERLCFQTTYLNERYKEYFEHIGKFKLVFVIRNPYSVIYSMIYHWKQRTALRNFALNELFNSCGKNGLSKKELYRFNLFKSFGFSKLRKACLSYAQKTAHFFEIQPKIKNDIMVVEYDDIINKSNIIIPKIFSFFQLKYDNSFESIIHSLSLKKADKLSSKQKIIIYESCWKIYEKAISLKTL